jgi:hypothetical protein
MEQIDAALLALGSMNSRGQGHRKGHTRSAAARRKTCRRLASEMGKTEGRQEDGYGSGSVQFTKMPPTSKK